MNFDIEPDPEDVKRLLAALDGMMRRGENTRPVYDSWAGDLKYKILTAFDDSRSPYGDSWAALSAATLANPKRGKDAKPLLDDGHLRGSIQAFATYTEAEVGTNVLYALTHQFGDKDRNIPARPFFPIVGGEVALPLDLANDLIESMRAFLDQDGFYR